MNKISKTKTKYDSVMEFALFGKDNEEIDFKTMIATPVITKKPIKVKP